MAALALAADTTIEPATFWGSLLTALGIMAGIITLLIKGYFKTQRSFQDTLTGINAHCHTSLDGQVKEFSHALARRDEAQAKFAERLAEQNAVIARATFVLERLERKWDS